MEVARVLRFKTFLKILLFATSVIVTNVIVVGVMSHFVIRPVYRELNEQRLKALQSDFYIHYRLSNLEAAECSFDIYRKYAEAIDDDVDDERDRIVLRRELGINYARMALLYQVRNNTERMKECLRKSELELQYAGEKLSRDDVDALIKQYDNELIFICKKF
jgi:hypothetical protein